MKKMEDVLFTKLIDNIQDGVYFLDKERRITFWNQGAEEITGYKKDEAVGKRCSEDILDHVDEWGERICDESCPVEETLRDGKTHETKAYLKHKEGYRIPVFMRALPILNDNKEIVGAAEIFYDDSPKLTMHRGLLNSSVWLCSII